jgi:hypothetical protein
VSHDRGIRPTARAIRTRGLGSRLTARAGTAPTALAEEGARAGPTRCASVAAATPRSRAAVGAARRRRDRRRSSCSCTAPAVARGTSSPPRRRRRRPPGTLLLAPDARADTWDVLRGRLRTRRALRGPRAPQASRASSRSIRVRWHRRVSRMAASYALSLGLGNGDLFTT